jgi:guanine nucleotide exchange factor VAV
VCQEEANQGKFKLRDILSVPMQRILKYQLLLEKLLHETGAVITFQSIEFQNIHFLYLQNHEDSRFIENAKDAMVDVAQYINEVKRDADTLKIINDIEV